MPEDEWRKANHRVRYGPVRERQEPTLANDPVPKRKCRKRSRHTRFVIRAGLTCEVRLIEGGPWVEHVTTIESVLPEYTPLENGRYWRFTKDGYYLRINPNHVARQL